MTQDPRPVIAAVRDGRGLDRAGAVLIAKGLADGSVSDAQAGAFAMAVLMGGLDEGGRVALTRAMRDSGRVMRWDLPGPVLDKHSTGGIGDTVSLVLAPVLAACGAYVPMISGRGLGHTGGTLDKLEAIPGFRCALPDAEFRRVVADVGCAIVAAGPDLAPADARLYAIRDESATVGSVDLITASILSKKLAAGLDGLVLDVKQGSGAFLSRADDAQALARALVDTANGAGCRTLAYVTDMDQPLARAAGNALELHEAIAVLRGAKGALRDLTLALSDAVLALGGLAGAAQALDSGAAAEAFARMIVAQGGPLDMLENPDRHLSPAPVIRPIPARGRVAAIDTAALGHAVVALGGGRLHAGDRIDPRVGLAHLARIGDEAGPDRPLGFVHATSEGQADAAIATVQAAYLMGEGPAPGPLIKTEVLPR
ncbi:thymidine phosphorylase [Paracoccus laeviglucosivorans]|uniref:Thymidine phosphorylase n=1 Tax=Paracoccus laeviglucosivorans TaxID=1197861 RepID=A0A521AES1_9RHOB|nr:thymidine phosphorylase [Paracoccus laeviglucosivorans]SMO33292.1 thymidine phosphorylase [Paracoccus laeviglucosivorans]